MKIVEYACFTSGGAKALATVMRDKFGYKIVKPIEYNEKRKLFTFSFEMILQKP